MNSLSPLKDNVEFQIIDWFTENLEEEDDDELELDSSDESDEKPKYKTDESNYKIIIFGKDLNEKNIFTYDK